MSEEEIRRTFSNNLKKYLEVNGKQPVDIVNELGIPFSTVSNWINGLKLPRMGKVELLAHWLKIEKSDLLEEKKEDSPYYLNPETAQIAQQVFDDPNLRIPVLGRIAAGIPINAITEIIDWEEVRPEDVAGGEYFALQIRGDSMEPRIRNGDVIICRQQEDAEDGALVVAMVNGDDACCKKLKKYPNGAIGLMSTNPAYEPMIFTVDEVGEVPVRIIGLVKELRAKF